MANWDNDIDEIARRMTEGAPGAGFTTRVLARIETAAPGRPERVLWIWLPAAATAAVILAFLVVRPAWKTHPIGPKPGATANAAHGTDPAEANRDDTSRTSPGIAPAVSASDLRATSNAALTPSLPLSDIVPDATVVGRSLSNPAASDASASIRVAPAALDPRDRTLETIDRATGMDPIDLSPIPLAPLAVDAMATMPGIQVPRFAVAPLEVPALAIALLEVPAIEDASLEGRVQ